jgi:hypothetical protein
MRSWQTVRIPIGTIFGAWIAYTCTMKPTTADTAIGPRPAVKVNVEPDIITIERDDKTGTVTARTTGTGVSISRLPDGSFVASAE